MLATTVAVHKVVNVACRNGLHGDDGDGADGFLPGFITRTLARCLMALKALRQVEEQEDAVQAKDSNVSDSQEKAPTARTTSLILSFVAGYVDSCTFLALFGLFVAQVTGSFVAAGAQIARGQHGLLLATLAIPIFVVAGAATTLLVAFAEDRRSSPLAWSLALEAVLLTGFLVLGIMGSPFGDPNAMAAVIAGLFGLSAMGVQSASVQLVMHGTPSTNVMTTNTTQIAILATRTALCWQARRSAMGDESAAQLLALSDRLRGVLTVAAGFLMGTIVGALAYSTVDLWCLLMPIAAILGLLIWSLQSTSAR
jgi:uncharacterized membrane protein YoaK (UPF0700 family)